MFSVRHTAVWQMDSVLWSKMKLSQSVKAAIASLSKVSSQPNFLRDIFLPRLTDIWVEFAEKGQGTSLFFTRKPQV